MKHKIKILGLMLVIVMLVVVACGTPESDTAATDEGEDTGVTYEGEETGEGQENLEGNDGEIEDGAEGSTDGHVEEEYITIVVYQSNEQGDSLVATDGVIIESITPENVLQILIAKGEVSSNVSILSFNQSGGFLELDLSTEFNDFLAAQGSWGEFVVLGSVVNTFLSAFNAESITITVGGGVLEGPHIGEMSEPMGRFDIFGD